MALDPLAALAGRLAGGAAQFGNAYMDAADQRRERDMAMARQDLEMAVKLRNSQMAIDALGRMSQHEPERYAPYHQAFTDYFGRLDRQDEQQAQQDALKAEADAYDAAERVGRISPEAGLALLHQIPTYKPQMKTIPGVPATAASPGPWANATAIPAPPVIGRPGSPGPWADAGRLEQQTIGLPAAPAQPARTEEVNPLTKTTTTVKIGDYELELDPRQAAQILARLAQPAKPIVLGRGSTLVSPDGTPIAQGIPVPGPRAGGGRGGRPMQPRYTYVTRPAPDGTARRIRIDQDTLQEVDLGPVQGRGSIAGPDPVRAEKAVLDTVYKRYPRSDVEQTTGKPDPDLEAQREAYAQQLRRQNRKGKNALDRLLEAK